MGDRPSAAILTIGTELVTGLRTDTNTALIAAACTQAGYRVREATIVGDETDAIERTVSRLVQENALVIVAGGLGPTHDDVTREATARAIGRRLVSDADLIGWLGSVMAGYAEDGSVSQVLKQADVIEGASVIRPTTGTAPGQVLVTDSSTLVLLPGPPSEMMPMLQQVLGSERRTAEPVVLRCAAIAESDAQIRVQRALGDASGIDLALLASPSLVDVVLMDAGAGRHALEQAAQAALAALGERCYSSEGATLPETVVRLAVDAGLRIATAESCTGGTIAAALTEVPGCSEVYVGGVVAYSNALKTSLLGIPRTTLDEHGAVSEATVSAMAEGALRLGADVAVATTGIAGPSGGTVEKPVGLVWIATATEGGTEACRFQFHGDRAGIRTRATVHALDLLRLALKGA